jgi:CubicO group peptidase (beta-lactamase class C family)
MVWRKAIGAATALALMAPLFPAHAQAPDPVQLFAKLSDSEVVRRVNTLVERLKLRPEFVGLSIAVARGDHVILDHGYGMADLEWKQPATAATPFRIGSLTKQFTAAAIMKLVEQGKLGLDDPLSKYVPEFETGGRTVTIRQLLNHTSGIPNYTAQPGYPQKFAPLLLSDAEVLQLVAGKPFDFEPGKGWRYSNTNYYLLGMIVAKLGGRTYGDVLQAQLFGPLGLSHTRFGSEAAIIPGRAQGYVFDPTIPGFINDVPLNMTQPGGAGSLISTAGDLVRWQIALTNGRAVSPASYQAMITSTAPIAGGAGGAYGFGLVIDQLDGQPRITHTGGINGFSSSLTWLPNSQLRTAVISNSEGLPADWLDEQIILALTHAELPPPPRNTARPDAEAAVRKFIAEQANGTPDYATMSPDLAQAVRSQLPQMQPQLKAWGPVTAVTFRSVNLGGTETYRVEFANGQAVMLSLLQFPDGRIAQLNLRPAPR